MLVAVGALKRQSGVCGAARDDVDDPAHGLRAVQVGGAAPDQIDSAHGLARDAVPVDPAPERIVERDAVLEHERAAGSARAHAAQRDALRGRVCHAAARPAKQGEPRDLAQGIVEGQGGGGREVLRPEHNRIGCRVARAHPGASGGHGDAL